MADENLWIRDVRRHPQGSVHLYDNGRLISGAPAAQVIASIDRAAATVPDSQTEKARLAGELLRGVKAALAPAETVAEVGWFLEGAIQAADAAVREGESRG